MSDDRGKDQASQNPGPTELPLPVIPPGHPWTKIPPLAGGAGIVLLGTAALLGRWSVAELLASHLVAVVFFLSIALGAMFFVLVQFLARAGWSVAVRRIAENTMASIPLFAALMVPVAVKLSSVFPWASQEAGADEALRHKAAYLNPAFFWVRLVLYFLLWSAIALYYRHQSTAQDRSGDHAITRRLQYWSAPSIAVFALTVTFASFDWLMSLYPHWSSTIFGVYFFSGCVVAGFAFLAIATATLRAAGLVGNVFSDEHYHDLGKFLLAFTAFWAYAAFSQYFLIWYANMPEETVFYLARWQGSWRIMSVVLGVGHFAVPFFFLLPRGIKRRASTLVLASGWLLLMHYVDLYWLVMPAFHPQGARPSLVDLTTFLGVGSFFVAALAYALRKGALVPVQDPRLPESLSYENP